MKQYVKELFVCIVLLFLAIIFFSSCSDNEETVISCKCDARLKDEGGTGFYVLKDVELNCETNQPLELPSGTEFLGCDNRDIP